MRRHMMPVLGTVLFLVGCVTETSSTSNLDVSVSDADDTNSGSQDAAPLPAPSIDVAVSQQDMNLMTPPDMNQPSPSVDMAAGCENNCTEQRILWGRIGGRVAYDISYAIDPCRTQSVFVTTPFANDPNTNRCERVIADCTEQTGVDFEQLLILVAQTVSDGVCGSSSIYGIDSRPWDGQVLSIRLNDQECLIGDPCDGTVPGCLDPPDSLIEAADLLWHFGRSMEMTDPNCANLTDGL
jgi:hypothetical protein